MVSCLSCSFFLLPELPPRTQTLTWLISRRISEYHIGIDAQIIERAKTRGEVAEGVDTAHAALLFSAPIFYRHHYAHQPVDARWITAHVDQTVALLRSLWPGR